MTVDVDVERLDRSRMNAALRDPFVNNMIHAYSHSVSEQAEAICAEYDRRSAEVTRSILNESAGRGGGATDDR